MEQNKTFVELDDGSIVEFNAENLKAIAASITRKAPRSIELFLEFMRTEQELGLEGLSDEEKQEYEELLVAEYYDALTDVEHTQLCVLEARIGH